MTSRGWPWLRALGSKTGQYFIGQVGRGGLEGDDEDKANGEQVDRQQGEDGPAGDLPPVLGVVYVRLLDWTT